MSGRHGPPRELQQVVAVPRASTTTGKRRRLAVASVERGPLAVPRGAVVRFLVVVALLAVLSRQWHALLPVAVLLWVVARAR